MILFFLRLLILRSCFIVIADEAHKIKDPSAKVSQSLGLFSTKRRIGLTGSPLPNNVLEYYAVMDWVAPGYLGNPIQFKAKYAEPIQLAQYTDSSNEEKREGQRKLAALSRFLEPKVHRASIDAIKADIPPKEEYFITLSLTTHQIMVYNAYVDAVREKIDDATRMTFFGWFGQLTLLLNHPVLFLRKIDEQNRVTSQDKPAEKTTSSASAHELEDIHLATDRRVPGVKVRSQLLDSALKFYRDLERWGELDDPTLSYRTELTQEIVKKSVEKGDKVLIFSQTIPTLRYLEQMLKKMRYKSAASMAARPLLLVREPPFISTQLLIAT